jgi:hypothetical protein
MICESLTLAKTGEFFRIKRYRMELSTGQILKKNLLQSAYTRHWERNAPFRNTIIYKVPD